ncbi:MAG: four helix bundle protein [Parcubacteria group bacterium CG23_combo_of_CG06-09_8_20_14_all_35_9]|nr:MAG: four helix bundle protein [Parcubacteria group bacterium CG23_combo_of_CG06-09_8_20_14_all_35_9]
MLDKKIIKEKFRSRIYRYILRLIKFLVRLPNSPVIQEIKKQLTRSGTSIGANYFESEGASSKKDYQNFFTIALKSANESKFWLAVLIDSGLVPGELIKECNELLEETKEIANIFASSILTMKRKR